jgi:hypothetical protein
MSTNNPDPFSTNAGNPYAFNQTTSPPPSGSRGMVNHVMALSILMIVQGALCALCGLGAAAMAFVMPAMIRAQANMPGGPGAPAPPMPAEMETIMLVMYGGAGLVLLSIGILGIWGGVRTMKFRGYTMGIVALSGGLLAIFGCYCAPTAIALFIYGLIVLLNPQVKQAFEMGEKGYSPADIQSHFARLPS